MKAIIAQFYKTLEKAERRAKELRKLWRGRIGWFILEASNGCFVISESQARACGFIGKDWSYSNRAYKK